VKPRVFLTLRFLFSFLILSALAGLITWIGGLRLDQAWPFFLGAVGAAGLHAGMRKRQRFSASFAIPSIVFLVLSVFFSLFSFKIIPMRLKDFVLDYWPVIPLASLVFLAFSTGFFRWNRHQGGRGKKAR
jgi:hypothetical protein